MLHSGLDVQLGYDSNIFMASQSGGAGVLRLRAHLDLLTLPPQHGDGADPPNLLYRIGAWLEYRQFFSIDTQVQQSQQVNAASDAEVQIQPHQPLSLRLSHHFLLTTEPRNLEVADWQTFDPRIYYYVESLAVWRPLRGPLEMGISEAFRVDHYVRPELANLRSLANDVNLYGQLRLLPQTLARLELRWQYIRYYDNSDGSMPSAMPIRVLAGVHSMLLSWLGASVYLGYGNSLTLGAPTWQGIDVTQDRDPSYSNFIGGGEIRLHPSQHLRLGAGWTRDFFDSIYATFFKDDRFYGYYEHTPWKSLSLRARLDFYLRGYGALYDPTTLQYGVSSAGSTQRDDFLITFAAELTYRPLAWVEAGASYSLLYDRTAFEYVDADGMTVSASFTRHVVLFRVDLAY